MLDNANSRLVSLKTVLELNQTTFNRVKTK